MSTQNGSNKGMVPEARAAMDRFKMEAASDDAAALPQKGVYETACGGAAPRSASRAPTNL